MKHPNIKILVVYHKKSPVIKTNCLVPIQVGRALSKEKLNMIGDDTGENISIKNPNFCELTAMYWAWKNQDKLNYPDYVGLFHYRRLFDFKDNCESIFYDFSKKTCDKFGWNDKTITEYCQNYDIISSPIVDVHPPFKENKIISVKKLYKISHRISDLKTTLKVIKERYPEYYQPAIKYINGKKSSYFNMVIMKKVIFEDYSHWLFDILFEVEKRITIPSDPYQSRVFGFLGERLLNIYMRKLEGNKNIKINYIKSIPEGNFRQECRNSTNLFYSDK